MSVARIPVAALAWLGRQGTRAVAASIFLGLAVPPLAATFKPYVPEAIFVLLVLAFLRVDPSRLRGYVTNPKAMLLATGWMMLVTPIIMGSVFMALGLKASEPGLYLALILQACSAPLMAAPAFAALLGLDAALTLAALVACMIATPFTAPLFVWLFVGDGLTLPAWTLGFKLFALLAGSAGLAVVIRHFAGRERVNAANEVVDGMNVLVLLFFAIAVMDGVAARLVSDPLLVAGLLVLVFALLFLQLAAATFVFLRMGLDRAFALGLTAGNRNMGLMVAAAGTALPDTTWLYVALAQFPIYLAPLLLGPLARRVAPPRSP